MEGARLEIDVRGHRLVVDQPTADGGTDVGPTPTELFVAALASCVGYYAVRFLDRHGIDPAGLVVRSDFAMESGPARVGAVRVCVEPPAALPPERRAAFHAVISHCTVHNSLQDPPPVTIEVDIADPAAA